MRTKKELINEYKQMKPAMGVFQVKSQANGKVLIEASPNMAAKWNRHRMELKFGRHRNQALQGDWNEFGPDNFVFEVLSELEAKNGESADYHQELKVLEEMVVKDLNLGNNLRY